MKKLTLSIIGLLAFVLVNAQNPDTTVATKDTTRFFRVEILPEFPGGLDKMMQYFDKNLKYPKQAKIDGTEGKVFVSFVVEKDGSLTDIKIKESLSPETDSEAIRLVTNSPKWIPGMQGGHPVRVQYSIPVFFRLNN